MASAFVNIGLVGGGQFTAEVLQKTKNGGPEHELLRAKIQAVADPDPEAPGMHKARNLGLVTLQDYKELYDPELDVNLIIIMQPSEEVLHDVLGSRPPEIRIMSYHTFRLFWEAISTEADKLRKRTQEIEAILDGIQDFIVVISPDLQVIEVNKAFLDQMGFERDEVIGKPCYEVFQRINRHCKNNADSLSCPLHEVMLTRKSSHKVFPRVNAEGKVVYIEVSLYPIWEDDGSLSRFIEVSRDVSKREREDEEINRRLEEMVEKRTKQLKQRQQEILHQDKMASLGKLSASVVHEINNPISGILNLILLIQKMSGELGLEKEKTEKFSRYLKLIETETRRISRITSNLLSFSRESKIEMQPLNVNHLLEEILFLNANFLKINQIRLHKELDPGLPDLVGDGEKLKQVFMNLVSNACEAMLPYGQRELTIKTRQSNNHVQIVFQDTGIGVEQKDTDRIFDPFFSTKQESKGVGLGLSVAYGIVQQHCGKLELTSQPGQGTTVTVTLPLQQPKEKYE
ncbi:MAG: ATP-binding protein [Desulfohalobiaceae bacterium]